MVSKKTKISSKTIHKLENTNCTTLGIKLTLLDVANGKAVCRMSQVFPTFSFKKLLILQLCLSPSPFHVSKILIFAMPNADNLIAPC